MRYPAVGPRAQIQRQPGAQYPVVTREQRPRVSAATRDLGRIGQQLLHVGWHDSRELGSRPAQVTPAELDRKVFRELVADIETSAEAAAFDTTCHDLIAVSLEVVGDIARTERARYIAQISAKVPAERC